MYPTIQVSRSVEDVLQETLNLLNAAEEVDAQPSLQVDLVPCTCAHCLILTIRRLCNPLWSIPPPSSFGSHYTMFSAYFAYLPNLLASQTLQSSRQHLDSLLLSYRHANSCTESLQMDLVLLLLLLESL